MGSKSAERVDAAELTRRSITNIPDHVFTIIINVLIGLAVLLATVAGGNFLLHLIH